MPGKIFTISQQKGGTGKTTLAAHLAICWSVLDGKSVAILDTDPQGSLGEWLETRERCLGEEGTGLGFRTASGWGARREARSLARDLDLWATEPILSLAAGEKSDAILVLNRVPARAKLTGEMQAALSEFSVPTARASLGNRVVYASSIGAGKTALELEPRGKASDEVRALAKELMRRASR